jgi:decaprenylphospho-beta-D-ribofuranose 2-oxidase
LPSTPTSSIRGYATSTDQVRVVQRDRSGSIENVGSVAALREHILNAPVRGLILADGAGQRADWSTNAGGRRIRQVGPLAKPAVEWIDWDRQTARITPGASVAEATAALLAQGWCLPTLSGDSRRTIAATVSTCSGGAHQQRHTSLADAIRAIEMIDGSGELQRLTPADPDPRAFWGVIGGLGLLGIITAVELAIRPVSSGWLLVDSARFETFDEILAALVSSTGDRYCVATLDTSSRGESIGRGSVLHARHARVNELPTPRQHAALSYETGPGPRSSMPIPTRLRQTQVGRLLSDLRHRSAPPQTKNELQPVADFFHRRAATPTATTNESGWLNYDFCVPDGTAEVLTDFLEDLSVARIVGLAATITRVDTHQVGPLNWGQSGYSIHLALPTDNSTLPALLDAYDERIADAGGCVRLATDSRVRPDVLAAMYPQLDDWYALRTEFDPQSRLRSDLSRRLSL